MFRFLLILSLFAHLLHGVPVLNINAPSFVPRLKASEGFLPIQDLLDSPDKWHHMTGKEVEHYLGLLFFGNHGLQADQRSHALQGILNDPMTMGRISRSEMNNIFNALLKDGSKTADLLFLQDSVSVQAKLWGSGKSDDIAVAPSELITYLNNPHIDSEVRTRVREAFLGKQLGPEDIYELMFHSGKATSSVIWRGLDFPFGRTVKEAFKIASTTVDPATKNLLFSVIFQNRLVFWGPNPPASGYVFTNLHDFCTFLVQWKDFLATDAMSLVKFLVRSEKHILRFILSDIAWSESLEELLVLSLLKTLPYPSAVNEFLQSNRLVHLIQMPKIFELLLGMSATSAEARRDLVLFLKHPKLMSLIPQSLRIGLLDSTKVDVSARNMLLANEFFLADLIKNQLYMNFRKQAMDAQGDLAQFLLSQEHHDALTRTLPLFKDSPTHNWLIIEGVDWILTYWKLFIAQESGADVLLFSTDHVEALIAAQSEASDLVLLGKVSDDQLSHLKSLTQKWLNALLDLAYKNDRIRSLLKSPEHHSILPTLTLFGLDTNALHWFLVPSTWGSHPWVRPVPQLVHV